VIKAKDETIASLEEKAQTVSPTRDPMMIYKSYDSSVQSTDRSLESGTEVVINPEMMWTL
jgi:hypothetical protein